MRLNSQPLSLWPIFALQFNSLNISTNQILLKKGNGSPLVVTFDSCGETQTQGKIKLFLLKGKCIFRAGLKVQSLGIIVSVCAFALSSHKAKQKVAKAYCHPFVSDGTYSSKKHPVPWACSHMLQENVTSQRCIHLLFWKLCLIFMHSKCFDLDFWRSIPSSLGQAARQLLLM